MDVYCATCGEPWDVDYLRYDADPREFLFVFEEREAVLKCPCCNLNGERKDANERKQTVCAVTRMLRGDGDAIAAELSVVLK